MAASETETRVARAPTDSAEPPARDRLIRAAARLFAEKSFGGVSVREICKEAGTGINMIHHYFGNKEGLLEAIIAQYDARVFLVPMRLLKSPARSRDDLASRVEMIFETALEACLEERDVMMVVFREQAELEILAAFQGRLVEFLNEAKAAGLVRVDLDTDMISGAVLDRIVSQVQFAPWIQKTTGIDIKTDADYRTRWCRANADLFLNGMLSS